MKVFLVMKDLLHMEGTVVVSVHSTMDGAKLKVQERKARGDTESYWVDDDFEVEE
jgi:hypothetical protein